MRKLRDILKACGGKLICGDPEAMVSDFVIDSRRVKTNSAFVALKGENTDGNLYICDAAAAGASLCITGDNSRNNLPSGCALMYCPDVVSALGEIAAHYRRIERKTVVGVTGSVGKTTVRELCGSVLSKKRRVCVPDGNFNNLLGLPLTLLKDDGAETAVVEAGISVRGEMERLSYISAPDVAVVTNIGTMHTETLGARENIAREKLKIRHFMKENSILVIPDDPIIKDEYTDGVRVLTVSEANERAHYLISENKAYPGGRLLSVRKRGIWEFRDIFVPIVGAHGGLDAAYAVVVADQLGYTEKEIREGIKSYKPCGNRQKIEEKNGITLISDCYNSGPKSLEAALEAFTETVKEKERRGIKVKKVLLLGSMLELGEISEEEHFRLGKSAAECNPDMLITFGNEAKGFALGAEESGLDKNRITSVVNENDTESVMQALSGCFDGNAVVMIKGSRRLRMERFSEYLISNRI